MPFEVGVPQVVTYSAAATSGATGPAAFGPRYLSTIGHVNALKYSYILPGGCDQLSCLLLADPRLRTDAMDPGRTVQVQLNGSVLWDGTMLEPLPSDQGWAITAVGTASWGTNYQAVYTGAWGTGTPDNAVNAAIVRGLRWVNPGIGNPSGMWVGQAVDSGAQTITDLMNLICSNGGLTWYVQPKAVYGGGVTGGNILTVFTLPTTVNRLLVATTPVGRTLGGNLNRIYERYQSTADTPKTPAVFSLTNSDDTPSINKFGQPLEAYIDLSSVGLLSAGAAQAVGNLILKRYQRANYAGPFTVQPGQLLSLGGQPVDLAQEQAGTVCQLVTTDYPYAGEQVPGPVSFLVGAYEYDAVTETGTVTPFQSLAMTVAGEMGEPRYTAARVHHQPKKKKKVHGRHARPK